MKAIIGEYLNKRKIEAYEVLDIETGKHSKVQLNELQTIEGNGENVQNLWSDDMLFASQKAKSSTGYISPLAKFIAKGGRAKTKVTSVPDAIYEELQQYYGRQVCNKYTCWAIVAHDEEECILYNYLTEEVCRISNALAVELAEYNDLATPIAYTSLTNGPVYEWITIKNNANPKPLISNTYIDEYGWTHIVCNESLSTFVTGEGEGEYIASIRVPGIDKLVVTGSVHTLRVENPREDKNRCLSFSEDNDPNYYEHSTVREIEIKEGVQIIGNDAFLYCGRLMSVSIPNSVEHIGANVFRGCTSLKNVNIPNGLRYITRACFSSSGISSIDIPNSVIYIGDEAFAYAMSLKSITIPSSVEHIGRDVFIGCSNLQEVTIESKHVKIDKQFSACGSLKIVRVPKELGVKEKNLGWDLPEDIKIVEF